MTRDEVLALVKVLNSKRRPAEARTLEIPAPQVRVENLVEAPQVHNAISVPAANVVAHVDTAPIADAMRQIAAVLADALEREAKLVERLADILENQPVPVVEVPPAQVVVEAPRAAVRPPRKFRVRHSDGTETSVVEE